MKRKSENGLIQIREDNGHSNNGKQAAGLFVCIVTFISIFHNLLRNQIDSLDLCSCPCIYYVNALSRNGVGIKDTTDCQ